MYMLLLLFGHTPLIPPRDAVALPAANSQLLLLASTLLLRFTTDSATGILLFSLCLLARSAGFSEA